MQVHSAQVMFNSDNDCLTYGVTLYGAGSDVLVNLTRFDTGGQGDLDIVDLTDTQPDGTRVKQLVWDGDSTDRTCAQLLTDLQSQIAKCDPTAIIVMPTVAQLLPVLRMLSF